MDTPLVSVIVPVYKVEPYLRKCLDSIIGQTYRNLEIILVDDGSPDNCGAICDEYAGKDERIVVIHKVNGGVSSARNAGLDAAKGEWIAWVDSDDWVSSDHILCMITNAQESGADIVICGGYEEYRGKSICYGPGEKQLLGREGALEKLIEDKEIHNYAWDKLWKASLFQNLRFPTGRTYEDVALSYQLFQKAERVLCIQDANYHYVIRDNSIMGNISLSNRLNHYRAARERYEELRIIYPQFSLLLKESCLNAAVGVWCGYNRNKMEDREKYKAQVDEIAAFAKEHRTTGYLGHSIGLAGRMVMHLLPYRSWWAFALSGCIGRLYQFKHGRAL